MPEYIERETLFEEIRKEFRPYWQIPCDYEDKVTQKMVTKMRGLIDKLTAADVVEVIRCKNCKNYKLMKSNNSHFCNEFGGRVTEKDFCSRAQKMDGGT